MRPYVFAGGTAVVTGAASGIGEALAHALAHVVLDRRADVADTGSGGSRGDAAPHRLPGDLAQFDVDRPRFTDDPSPAPRPRFTDDPSPAPRPRFTGDPSPF